jgi:hypothetical protein
MVNLEQVVWGLPLRPPPGEAAGGGQPTQRYDPIELWGWLCNTIVPALLATAGTPWDRAQEVGRDIETRGQQFAACGIAARDRLVAPLLDEAAGHEPAAARLWLRAAVLAVVRDGLLGRERALGRLTSTDVVALTRAMTWPLSLYLALYPCPVDDDHLEGVFAAPGTT